MKLKIMGNGGRIKGDIQHLVADKYLAGSFGNGFADQPIPRINEVSLVEAGLNVIRVQQIADRITQRLKSF
jgi:hypothetical protein